MTDTDFHATPQSQTGNFHAEGRTVPAGRGWDWIVEAFALFRKQPGIWILAAVVLGILFIAISMIPLLGSLANALLFPIFGAGLMLGCKALDQSGTLEISHLFAGFKQKTGDLVLVGVFNVVGWVVIGLAVMAVVGGGVFMAMMRGGTPGAGLSILSMLIAMLLVAGLSVPLYMATWFAPAIASASSISRSPASKSPRSPSTRASCVSTSAHPSSAVSRASWARRCSSVASRSSKFHSGRRRSSTLEL